MTSVAVDRAPGTVRGGFSYWWDSLLLMIRWELTSLRRVMVLLLIVQAILGMGMILAIGLFFPEVPPLAALFVSTGAPTMTLITIGMVVGPQMIAEQKTEQTYDFLASLPVPRSTSAIAWLVVTAIISIPGMVSALVVGSLRFDLDLTVSLAIVPAALATLATGTMVGYAMAHAIPNPLITQLLSQVTIFVIFGFSPINFPIEQLPGWLGTVNRYLPFHHMALVVRGGLTDGLVGSVWPSYAVLALWGAASIALAAWVVGRRR